MEGRDPDCGSLSRATRGTLKFKVSVDTSRLINFRARSRRGGFFPYLLIVAADAAMSPVAILRLVLPFSPPPATNYPLAVSARSGDEARIGVSSVNARFRREKRRSRPRSRIFIRESSRAFPTRRVRLNY